MMRIMALLPRVLMMVGLLCFSGSAQAAPPPPVPETPGLASKLSAMVARPGGLVADDVAQRAVKTSFTLEQRRHEVAAAIASTNQALIAYLPRLSLLARYARLSNITAPLVGDVAVPPPGTPTGVIAPGTPLINFPIQFPVLLNQTTLQATLTVPLLDYVLRAPALNAAARASHDSAKKTEGATRLQVGTDARVAYYGWARARLSAVVADLAVAQARGHHEVTRRLFEAGAASKADTMRVEAQLASAELFAERSHNQEIVLEEQVRIAMHDEGRHHYEIGEDLNVDLQAINQEPLRGLYEEAWTNRLEPAALKDAERALHSQSHAALGAALPRVDAFGDLVDANPNQRFFPFQDKFDFTWDVGLQLTWTPNDTATNVFAAKNAEQRAQATASQIAALKDQLRLEVVQAYQATREADFAVQATARGLDAAEESYRVRRELFTHGRSTSFELTDAETDLTQARLSAIGARIDQRITRARLRHSLGRDVSDGGISK
jgi:outer membrane protein TolC